MRTIGDNMSSGNINLKVKGHVLIEDKKTGEILLDKDNAIHNQNMAVAIARGLSNTDFSPVGTHQIYALALGNGGSDVNGLNQITYLPPNVSNGSADRLYNQTYFEVVDEQQSGVTNSVTYLPNIDGTSVVIVSMTVAAGEPSGQDISDSPPDPNFNSEFAFDELGLFSYGTNGTFVNDNVPVDSLLLTHIIFSPILKTANRELQITYTLTVSVS
jgi:hypothetical protein